MMISKNLSTSKFGLTDSEYNKIIQVFRVFELDKVFIFGSRARGDYRPNSDVDLVCYQEMNFKQFLGIKGNLNNLSIGPGVDFLLFNNIKEPKLVELIKRDQKLFYEQN